MTRMRPAETGHIARSHSNDAFNRSGDGAAVQRGRLAASIEDGTWRPAPGSVAARLATALPASTWTQQQTISRFARAACRSRGADWWLDTLNADAAALSDPDAAFVAVVWADWRRGLNPFRPRPRRAA